MNICLICDHETDYNLKCFVCKKSYLVDLEKYDKKVILVLSDPRFFGDQKGAEKVVKFNMINQIEDLALLRIKNG